jgi:hypothetical protein
MIEAKLLTMREGTETPSTTQRGDFLQIESIWEMRNKYGKPKRASRQAVGAQIANSHKCCFLICSDVYPTM